MTRVDCCESYIPELSFPIPRGKAKLIFQAAGGGDVRTVWNDSRQRMDMIWKDGKTPQPLFRGLS